MAAGGNCLVYNGNFFAMGATEGLKWRYGEAVVNDLTKFDKYVVEFTATRDKQVGMPSDCVD